MCSFSLTSFYSFRCCYCWRFCCCFCWCFSCWYCCLLHFIVAFSRALFRSVVYLLSAYCINERHWATKPPRNVGTRARGCSVARQSIVLSPVLGVNRTNTHVQTFNSNNNNRKEKKHQIQTHTKLYWNSANEQKKKGMSNETTICHFVGNYFKAFATCLLRVPILFLFFFSSFL